MERPELNSASPEEEAEWKAWLRAAEPPLPDHGFADRVLAALPPPPAPILSRPVVCGAASLAGLTLAVVKLRSAGGLRALQEASAESAAQVEATLIAQGGPWLVEGLLLAVSVTLVSLYYAFRPQRGLL